MLYNLDKVNYTLQSVLLISVTAECSINISEAAINNTRLSPVLSACLARQSVMPFQDLGSVTSFANLVLYFAFCMIITMPFCVLHDYNDAILIAHKIYFN